MRSFPLAVGGLGIALVVLSIGCGSRPASRPAAQRAAPGPEATSSHGDSLDELPEALLQPAIGPDDSLMRRSASPLAEWVQLWRAARPEFALDSLRFAGLSAFQPQPDATPWEFPKPADEEGLTALVVPSPDGRYRLLIDRYQVITGGEIGGEPDSAPVLLDTRTGRTYTFEFCGTTCGFHWAAWIDSTRFVLGGWGEADSHGQRSYGTLGYYDLQRGVQARYLVPLFSSEEYARYVTAWHDWVMKRASRPAV